MGRPFSSESAKRLIVKHQELKQQLDKAISEIDAYKSEIASSANQLHAQELLNVLRGIPVEEINRGRLGLRVKALRESGYDSVADIYSASVYELASIYGISENGAYSIKHIADDMAKQADEGIKIHLSLDNKTAASGKLLLSVLRYRKARSYRDACQRLLYQYSDHIEQAIEDLDIAKSGFRWFFASKAKKEQAITAYDTLRGRLKGNFTEEARNILGNLQTIETLEASDAWLEFGDNPIQFTNSLDELAPGLLGTQDASYGLPENLARAIQDECFFPDGLLCQLRTYQEWGVKYALHQGRVLLGDEMGLGKTIQAIATMVSLKNTGATHFVVVCPASVLINWCREIQKHSKLRVIKVHGADKAMAFHTWLKTGGVAVTTYETTSYFGLEKDFRFTLLVVDEAHYIKNENANRTFYVKILCRHAERLLFMTGTALENKVDEMISLIQILQPAVANSVLGMESLASAPAFREKVAPVYFRRKRSDVLKELPELIESREWCALLPEEEQIYEEAVMGGSFADARRVSWSVDNLDCSSKALRMKEIIQAAKEEGRKVIVFSFFLDTIRKIVEYLGGCCVGPINGSVPPQHRQEIIDGFDSSPAGTVLVAQIQSGGTGLNIQSASVVIICEPQFKPSVENQAISRAYRMGQTRNVLVYRLLCENTVDERLCDLLDAKQRIFDEFADESVAAQKSIEIDTKSFDNIIKGEIDRINAKHAKEHDEN